MNEVIYTQDRNGRENDEIKSAASALLVWSGLYTDSQPRQVPDALSDKLLPCSGMHCKSFWSIAINYQEEKSPSYSKLSFFFSFLVMTVTDVALSKAVKNCLTSESLIHRKFSL